MPQTFRILRDNKEQGPMTLEELLGLTLKPFDLIWVEGKSAGWRYPNEIDVLRSYMPESGNIEKPVNVLPQAHPASNNTRSASAINTSTPAAPVLYHDEEPEEELTAEKLDRKAAELYQRIQAYSQQNEQQQKGVQTKYARSLEDLKQEYADWLHHKKAKKKFSVGGVGKKSLVGVGVAGMVILLTFFFIFGKQRTSDARNMGTAETYVNHTATYKPIATAKKQTATSLANTAKATTAAQSGSTLSVDAFIDSVEREMAKHDARLSRKASTYSKKKEEAVVTKQEEVIQPSLSAVTNPMETIQAPVKKEAPSSPVNMNARYEQDPTRHNISSLEVTIRNNSDDLLRTVTVDVFYYKKGERLFDKETLYFNNIQPGNSLTLSLPGNKKAVTARFQLGQVNALQN